VFCYSVYVTAHVDFRLEQFSLSPKLFTFSFLNVH